MVRVGVAVPEFRDAERLRVSLIPLLQRLLRRVAAVEAAVPDSDPVEDFPMRDIRVALVKPVQIF
jgi:hypothetical protein